MNRVSNFASMGQMRSVREHIKLVWSLFHHAWPVVDGRKKERESERESLPPGREALSFLERGPSLLHCDTEGPRLGETEGLPLLLDRRSPAVLDVEDDEIDEEEEMDRNVIALEDTHTHTLESQGLGGHLS